MRRLTIHLKNQEKVSVGDKQKTFNTVSVNVKTELDEQLALGKYGDNVTKSYTSNIK